MAARLASEWIDGAPVALRHPLVVGLLIGAGAVFLLAAFLPAGKLTWRGWLGVLLVAAGMRAAMWTATPTAGDDFERYLWDGAVTAAGRSPYRYSPLQAGEPELADAEIRALAGRSDGLTRRINHGHLRTIYPPVAQGLFAVAHWLTPFDSAQGKPPDSAQGKPPDVLGWRLVLLAADAATVALLAALLRALKLPGQRLVIYLWNPLIVFETYARLHADLAVAPLVILLVWALVRRRAALAGLALGLAAGVKLWPVLLLGFVVGRFRSQPRRLAVALGCFAAVAAAMAVPFAEAFGGPDSGVVAYSLNWTNVGGAFVFLKAAGGWVRDTLGLYRFDPGTVGRGLMMTVLVAFAAFQGVRAAPDDRALGRRAASVLLLMLLLSPTLWPWYYLPLAALAVVDRRGSLLAWTALLPLAGAVWSGRVQYALVGAAVHAPIWALLTVEWLRRRRRRGGAAG